MNTPSNITEPTGHGTIASPGLAVVLRRQSDQPVLTREPVTSDDLRDAKSEMWRDCFLRRGRLDLGEEDLVLQVNPTASSTGASRLSGFALEATPGGDGGGDRRSEFSIHALEAAAHRGQSRLIQAGTLQAGDTVYYELEEDPAQPGGLSATEAPSEPEPFQMTVRNPPTHFLSVPLAPLLEQARPEGEGKADVFPVFYTEETHARAERFSRKGAEINPRFESGAVLAGALCSCPDSGEFFLVVTDTFEVTDAESSLVSLEYSGKSWARIQSVIKARQAVDPAVRVLGQAHGHNFLPHDGETCAECPKLEVCSSSNVFASADDRNWTRAVFSHQPWALCHIFGLTARGDLVQGLFSLHDARLLKRNFHVLPGFDPGQHPTLSIAR